MLHEDVTERVIAAAMRVHTGLGAGLLESAYHACLLYEFGKTIAHAANVAELLVAPPPSPRLRRSRSRIPPGHDQKFTR